MGQHMIIETQDVLYTINIILSGLAFWTGLV